MIDEHEKKSDSRKKNQTGKKSGPRAESRGQEFVCRPLDSTRESANFILLLSRLKYLERLGLSCRPRDSQRQREEFLLSRRFRD